MIACPNCLASMRVVHESGIEIDICDSCNAVWLDPGELNDVARSAQQQVLEVFAKDKKHVALSCPRCAEGEFLRLEVSMRASELAIEVVRCNGCGGVYIDNENLDRLRGKLSADVDGKGQSAAPTNPNTSGSVLIEALFEILIGIASVF